MREYIYILTNSAFPGLLKIGFTSRTPEERCAELSAASGVPSKFEVAYSLPVGKGEEVEHLVHKQLDKFRVNERREFFRLPLQKAISAVNYCSFDYLPAESTKDEFVFISDFADEKIIALIKGGRFIHAIKELRALYGMGLQEASEEVTRIANSLKETSLDESGKYRWHALGVLIAIVLLAVVFALIT